jgi:prepilin-type N-terminal cleavage/methylation domain-containing protein
MGRRMSRRDFSAGFTWIELLVVISIIVVLLLLAMPALTDALNKREMDRMMINMRALYLASLHMATDGAAKSDANAAWPGDYDANTLADYCTKLVQNGYLKAADLQKFLSAPGAICTVTTAGGGPGTVSLAGKSALKIYKVKRADTSNTIFAASSNYIYDTDLSPTTVPFGDRGFVVIRKSGDAGVYKKNQATPAGYENNAARFQSDLGIGKLPGAEDGIVVPGDGATVLAGPP